MKTFGAVNPRKATNQYLRFDRHSVAFHEFMPRLSM